MSANSRRTNAASAKIVFAGDCSVGKTSLCETARIGKTPMAYMTTTTVGAHFFTKTMTAETYNRDAAAAWRKSCCAVDRNVTNSDDEDTMSVRAAVQKATVYRLGTRTAPSPSPPCLCSDTIVLNVWDTAGAERFRAMLPIYYKKSDCIVLVYDVSQPHTFRALDGWVDQILEQAGGDAMPPPLDQSAEQRRRDSLRATTSGDEHAVELERERAQRILARICVVGNKRDLAVSRRVSERQAEAWCFRNNIQHYVETTMFDPSSVDALFAVASAIAISSQTDTTADSNNNTSVVKLRKSLPNTKPKQSSCC